MKERRDTLEHQLRELRREKEAMDQVLQEKHSRRSYIDGFLVIGLGELYITKLPADWSISTLLWNDTIPSIYFTYTCSHINTVTVETG